MVTTDTKRKMEKIKKMYSLGSMSRTRLISSIRLVLSYIENIEKQDDLKLDIDFKGIRNKLSDILRNKHIVNNHYIHVDEIFSNLSENNSKKSDTGLAEVQHWADKIHYLEDIIKDLGIRLFKKVKHDQKDSNNNDFLFPSNLDSFIGMIYEINLLEMLLGKTKVFSYPETLLIDTSNLCNFRCKMCTAHSSGVKTLPAHFSNIKGVQDIFPYVKRISFGGTGEPLLYPYLDVLAGISKKYGLHQWNSVEIITNGSLIDKRLSLLEHIDKIVVSFDGANKRTFESLRAGAKYERIVDNIKLIRSKYPEKSITFNVVVSRLNVDELVDIVKLGVNLGVKEVVFNPIWLYDRLTFLELATSDYDLFKEQIKTINNITNGNEILIVNNLTEEWFVDGGSVPRNKKELYGLLERTEYPKSPYIRDIKEIENELKVIENFEYYPVSIERYIRDRKTDKTDKINEEDNDVYIRYAKILLRLRSEFARRLLSRGKMCIPFCTAPWTVSYLNSDGTARACCTLPIEASISDKQFLKFWNSPAYIKLREAMTYKAPIPELCQNCKHEMKYARMDKLVDYADEFGAKLDEQKTFVRSGARVFFENRTYKMLFKRW
ncbi:MAG: hypothetical protein SRB2_00424 [Desulfobacteraceae bacterium Eth-SRB2]|nr:MAG: hypothetical protein SRB2_00424 [Desulfobacteraceae bacterium Eth-SRB2]